MSDITNAERGDRAARALEYYIAECDEGADWHTAVTDLLADLLHFAADSDDAVDFNAALRSARMHYAAEVSEAIDEGV